MGVSESASQLERLSKCPSSAAMPQIQTSTKWSTRGTAVHHYIEVARTKGRDAALEAVDEEHHELCSVIDLEALPEGVFAAEVAFAYDVATGEARELGRGRERQYGPLGPFEIPGTADAVAVSMDAVFVPDWKTGWSEVQPPERNKQLRFLALAAARAYRRDTALVEVVRIREDGSAWRLGAKLDEFDLAVIAAELRDLHFTIEARRAQFARGEELEVHEGAWCRYCPAYVYCPAKTRLIRELGTGNDPAAQIARLDPRRALDQEQLAHAWRKLKVAKGVLGRIEAGLREHAKRHPIPLGDNAYLGLQEVTGNELLDGRIAWRVVAEQRGREVADEVVEHKMTKKAIDKAVRKTLKQGEKIKHANESILTAIRNAGGASRKSSRKVVEFVIEGGES